jgi:hypothetical protein
MYDSIIRGIPSDTIEKRVNRRPDEVRAFPNSQTGKTLPWIERPTIEVDLDRPIDLSYRQAFPEALASSRALLEFIKTQIPRAARFLAYLVRLRTVNRFHREIVNLAKLVDADWRDVTLANITYDLVVAQMGCSTIALPTPRGPVIARNMDWSPEDLLARASYSLRCMMDGRLKFVSAGWPGATGVVTGLSAGGFAVALNAVPCPRGISKIGYPVLLHLRRVLEDAANFDAALRLLTRQRLAAPALFTLIGVTNNQRVVIERMPTQFALRWGEPDEALLVTNHFRILSPIAADPGQTLLQTSCPRFSALCEFFSGTRANRTVTDEELLYVLSDARVMQNITAQHVIMRPRDQQIRLFVPRHLLSDVEL